MKHGFGLSIIGGGHSGHCLWSHFVSVDKGAFGQAHVVPATNGRSDPDCKALVVAEAGCKTGDAVQKYHDGGCDSAFGARPSVGAGLWLQGGIGHQARLHGLACDAIVGAVMVSVKSGGILCIGHVPTQYKPAGAVFPKSEVDLLWATKGPGSNFGIVIGVIFRTYAAPTYSIRNWIVPLSDNREPKLKLSDFDNVVASKVPRNCSAGEYLYWDYNQLQLGITFF